MKNTESQVKKYKFVGNRQTLTDGGSFGRLVSVVGQGREASYFVSEKFYQSNLAGSTEEELEKEEDRLSRYL
jgi:hypothetical protein